MTDIAKLKAESLMAVKMPGASPLLGIVLELIAALEAKDAQIAEILEKQRLINICQGQGLEHRIAAEKRAEAAEKRIAELETRKVTLKLPRYSFFDFREGSPYQSGAYCNLEALINECKKAGINLETGGEYV